MIKAFLSHSSADKDGYVRKVAEWLGKDNIHYDEWTFEEGEKPLDEILSGLGRTDLFVLFLSQNALKSEWVQREILEAKALLSEDKISKIFPIIIDDMTTYEDEKIPEWLRNYNLKPIKRAVVASKKIQNRLRELSWSKHPELKNATICLLVGMTSKMSLKNESMTFVLINQLQSLLRVYLV